MSQRPACRLGGVCLSFRLSVATMSAAASNAPRPQRDVGQGASGTQGASTGHAAEQGGRVTQSKLGGVVDGLSHWMDEPNGVPRVAVGGKDRTNRLKGLGNAIVPHIAMQIGLTIRGMNEQQQT